MGSRSLTVLKPATFALLLLCLPGLLLASTSFAPKPLFTDPHYHGSCDPEIIWNEPTGEWLIYYTARRASKTNASPAILTPIGVAASKDWRTWTFKGYCKFDGQDDTPDATHTYWAPALIRTKDTLHMFVTFKRGTNGFWGSQGEGIRHYVANSRSPLDWHLAGKPIRGEAVIDAGFVRKSGEWIMYYRDERKEEFPRGTTTFWAISRDLTNFLAQGPARGEVNNPAVHGFTYQEAQYPFLWQGHYWLLTDPNGPAIAVYRSDDAVNWTYVGSILDQPGRDRTDRTFGRHPSVAVVENRAFIFYHVEPDRDYNKGYPQQRVADRRTYLQMAELELREGKIVCDRDQPVRLPGNIRPARP